MFDIVAGKVVIDTKSLSIPPFAKYWSESKDKAYAENIIKYVVFRYKWNTPYKAYSTDERREKILMDVFGKPDIEFTEADLEFERRFIEFTATPLTRLLDASEEGVEYLIRQYNSLRAKEHEVDANGKPLVNANDVYKWLEKIAGAVKSLDALKKQVASEQIEGSRTRGNVEIGHYELQKR